MTVQTHEFSKIRRLGRMVCTSELMHRVFDRIVQMANTSLPVLITGESGVGKELAAEALHACSDRRNGPFVPINCAALTETLAESELFGHTKGAYTGASSDHSGAFVHANGGTIFLDEIGELPVSLQPKLLRTLESGTVRPVGSSRSRQIDVRILAATHCDLRAMCKQRLFREDLLYRLEVLTLKIPPLRHRVSDIPIIADALLNTYKRQASIHPDAMALLQSQSWQGNIRELRNVLLRAHTFALGPIDPESLQNALPQESINSSEHHCIKTSGYDYISDQLTGRGGHRRATYEALNIPKSTFYRWLREGKISDKTTAL